MVENREIVAQKGLSEWWNDEAEYVFQRIEKWAAFARGYSRLRPQKLFKDRQITQEQQGSFSDKLTIDETTPCISRFYNLTTTTGKSKLRSRPEEIKINCRVTFNYRSNGKLDNNCLETYRYDHSIYFKTIGDIKSEKGNDGVKDNEEERISISNEELVKWDANSILEKGCNNNRLENLNIPNIIAEQEINEVVQNTWPSIMDSVKLEMNLTNVSHTFSSISPYRERRNNIKQGNNNVDNLEIEFTESKEEKGP